MDREDIKTRIAALLSEILEQDGLVLDEATVAEDVEWWDSLNHLKLLVAIEGEWGISFQVAELTAPGNVGELIDLVQSKLQA